jgi:hypothetical protein
MSQNLSTGLKTAQGQTPPESPTFTFTFISFRYVVCERSDTAPPFTLCSSVSRTESDT